MQLFQSTLPRGERLAAVLPEEIVQGFQSTLPRGERRIGMGLKFVTKTAFQSTLPRGERLDRQHI